MRVLDSSWRQSSRTGDHAVTTFSLKHLTRSHIYTVHACNKSLALFLIPAILYFLSLFEQTHLTTRSLTLLHRVRDTLLRIMPRPLFSALASTDHLIYPLGKHNLVGRAEMRSKQKVKCLDNYMADPTHLLHTCLCCPYLPSGTLRAIASCIMSPSNGDDPPPPCSSNCCSFFLR